MLYNKVDCPHCGNEIVVTSEREEQKCCYCRRLISVKFEKKRRKGKKVNCTVEPIDFPQDSKPFTKNGDIYGY